MGKNSSREISIATSPPGRLLDIGCGCGREALSLSINGHQITAIDISPEQIALAHDLARRSNVNIDFYVTNGKHLAFPTNHFAYITIWGQVLGNIPGGDNRLSLLRQCYRVMKTKGKLSISVHNRSVCETISMRKGLILQAKDIELEDGDFIQKGNSDSSTVCYWHYFKRNELVDLIQKAGFRIIECDLASTFGQTGWDTIFVAIAEKN